MWTVYIASQGHVKWTHTLIIMFNCTVCSDRQVKCSKSRYSSTCLQFPNKNVFKYISYHLVSAVQRKNCDLPSSITINITHDTNPWGPALVEGSGDILKVLCYQVGTVLIPCLCWTMTLIATGMPEECPNIGEWNRLGENLIKRELLEISGTSL